MIQESVMVHKDKSFIPAMCALALIFCIFSFSGCVKTGADPFTTTSSDSTIEGAFSTYMLSAEKKSLSWCNHPLFTFEYPSVFSLVDEYEIRSVNWLDRSEINFVCSMSGTPYKQLNITVLKPADNDYQHYDNAHDRLENWLGETTKFGEYPNFKEVYISGMKAYYAESSPTPNNETYRLILFDFEDLIWEIVMITNSSFSEPKEIQQAFDHIVSSFHFLNETCPQNDSDDELDAVVEYLPETGVFLIGNLENTRLCEVTLYLDYLGDNVYSGYKYQEFYGIREKDSIKIESSWFKKSGTSYPAIHPKHVLLQAQFPGCMKVYSTSMSW